MSSAQLITENHEAWHEAYHRLRLYLDTYGLYDSIHTAEISLLILRRALEVHATTPEVAPTTVTLQVAKQMLQEWLGGILKDEALPRTQTLPIGHVALLLSQVPQRWSTSFLTHPLPEQLITTLQRSLMVTGPTLDISSMTPRNFDYGPMLQIARQTWHQWDIRRFVEAALFWSGVYVILYYSLYIYLYGLPQ